MPPTTNQSTDAALDYRVAFSQFVTERLHAFYAGIAEFYRERGGNPDSLSYFINHWPRFEAMVKLCVDKGVDPSTIMHACELGSWYPYTSFYWRTQNPDCQIDLYDIIVQELGGQVSEYNIDGVWLRNFNLCTDPLPPEEYDMVIVSEVLEHLPCNVTALCDDIVRIVKPGGYLLVTYPLGGKNARHYDRVMTEIDQTKLFEGHLREFTRDTVGLFFPKLKLVGSADVRYPAYGLIRVCLYQR